MRAQRLLPVFFALGCQASSPSQNPSPAPAREVSDKVRTATYEVSLGTTTSTVGQASAVTVSIGAFGEYHINRDYPVAFRPEVSGGTSFASQRIPLTEQQDRKACTEAPAEVCGLRAPLPFVPKATGKVDVAGELAFSVCSAETCIIEKVPLKTAVTVIASSP